MSNILYLAVYGPPTPLLKKGIIAIEPKIRMELRKLLYLRPEITEDEVQGKAKKIVELLLSEYGPNNKVYMNKVPGALIAPLEYELLMNNFTPAYGLFEKGKLKQCMERTIVLRGEEMSHGS